MTKVATYPELQSELESILVDMQREDIDVDVALKHYERGLELVALLEAHLTKAENRITEIKAQFSDSST